MFKWTSFLESIHFLLHQYSMHAVTHTHINVMWRHAFWKKIRNIYEKILKSNSQDLQTKGVTFPIITADTFSGMVIFFINITVCTGKGTLWFLKHQSVCSLQTPTELGDKGHVCNSKSNNIYVLWGSME